MNRYHAHTLVLGSGAAGLAAAVRLHAEGVEDVILVTEGLDKGTSINTGSDKQTYYKLGMYGEQSDSPRAMADSWLTGGSAHGDLALVEAAISPRAFFHLVNLGVPFPHDQWGQYIGYKTDHDPCRRATSCGPYTSREMCRALIREVKRRNIPIYADRVAIKLSTVSDQGQNRICGLWAVHQTTNELEQFQIDHLVFATGGPGGLYETSVYPEVHTGAIGLALEIGAEAVGLPESQFGLASSTDLNPYSTRSSFRWNVSGTYMQVLPRFISSDQNGDDRCEFLRDWFNSVGEMNSLVFLKGYQWPFDVRKIRGGSSLIDLIVYYERTVRNRRVFLDFRENPQGTDFNDLAPEARDYLARSNALFGTPFERLQQMNPDAIHLYRDHGIDLASEPLEIAVCAQHNNGGLAGDLWYQSLNIHGLFPVGEVNGSHGVARPGGSALNAGQVGAFRAAYYIANHTESPLPDSHKIEQVLLEDYRHILAWKNAAQCHGQTFENWRRHLRHCMSETASHLRDESQIQALRDQVWRQYELFRDFKNVTSDSRENDSFDTTAVENFRTMQLTLAAAVYLDAIAFQIESGTGSRGSALVVNTQGKTIHTQFPENWKLIPENESFRQTVLTTRVNAPFFKPDVAPCIVHEWQPVRPVPQTDDWFECIWDDFRKNIFCKENR